MSVCSFIVAVFSLGSSVYGFFHYSKWRRQTHMLTHECVCVCFFPFTCNCLVAHPPPRLQNHLTRIDWNLLSLWRLANGSYVWTRVVLFTHLMSCDKDREPLRSAWVNLWGDIKLVALRVAVTGTYGTDVGMKQSSLQVIRLFKMFGLSIARMFKELHYTETTGGFGQHDEMHYIFWVYWVDWNISVSLHRCG